MIHIHKFVDGFGAMGDALTCVKCGYSKYPEVLGVFSRLLPVIRNDHTYGSQREFPFVVRFAKPITFETDWSTWTHYFGRDGVLRPREDAPWAGETV
jgi:hypothetical protein